MKKVISKICLVVCIVILAYYSFGIIDTFIYKNINAKLCKQELVMLTECLKDYIEKHSGEFPSNENDLVQANMILIEKVPAFSEITYEIRNFKYDEKSEISESNKYWKLSTYFKDFKLNYGVKISSMEVKDRKLYNKVNGSQVFLIDGPLLFLKKKDYEQTTWELYQIIISSENEDNKAISIPSSHPLKSSR